MNIFEQQLTTSNSFDAINELITPAFTRQMATALAVEHSNMTAAIKAALGSILAAYTNSAPNSATETILRQASDSSLLADLNQILDSSFYDQLKPVGNNLLHNLFADNLADFIKLIANKYRFGTAETSVIISMVASIVAVFLGKKLVTGQSQQQLRHDIKNTLPSFLADIPNGMAQLITNTHGNPRKHSSQNPYNKTFYCFLLLALSIVFAKLFFK